MGISAPTANAKILSADSFLMIHFTALRHIVVRAANFIVLCDFVSARVAARPFAAPLGRYAHSRSSYRTSWTRGHRRATRRPSGREKAPIASD
jgi:hypothetical protein